MTCLEVEEVEVPDEDGGQADAVEEVGEKAEASVRGEVRIAAAAAAHNNHEERKEHNAEVAKSLSSPVPNC